jgi:hypothetical protein
MSTPVSGREAAMMNCLICHFDIEIDDLAIHGVGRRCVCLLCYGRVTGSSRPMPKKLQRVVQAALSALEPV